MAPSAAGDSAGSQEDAEAGTARVPHSTGGGGGPTELDTKPPSQSHRKEVFSMDDKKNVSFVSGLALILSALALLLIGITQISSSPYNDTMEQIVNTKMEDLEARLNMKIDSSIKRLSKAEESAALRELKAFEGNLTSWSTAGANGYTDQVNAVRTELGKLIGQMENKGTAPAQPAENAEEKK
jgi:hypothetical protein